MSNPGNPPAYEIAPHSGVRVDDEMYPWINQATAEVATVLVTLDDGPSFVYGSLIGLNRTIAKMADRVSVSDSESLQTALFNGLPSVLSGVPHSGISRVENSQHIDARLFVASRNLARLPGLVFAIDSRVADEKTPIVFRAGVTPPSEQSRLLGLLGVNAVRNRRRKSS